MVSVANDISFTKLKRLDCLISCSEICLRANVEMCGHCVPVNVEINWRLQPCGPIGETIDLEFEKTDGGCHCATLPELCEGVRYRVLQETRIIAPDRPDFGVIYQDIQANVLAK